MKPILTLLLLSGLVAGCSSVQVTTDFAEGTDFSQFRTFQYRDSTASLASSSPLSHQRIVNAIRAGMVSSGLTEVEQNPDVFVTYYGSIDQQTQFHTTYSSVNTWSGGRRRNHSMGFDGPSSITRPMTITEGTLMIDVWDAARNAMVWRGVATSVLSSDPQQNAQTIAQAVAKALSQFPPK